MSETRQFASIAALLGDPARSRMLAMLMSGQARTASELALDGDVSASTASSHLARLVDAGLVAVQQQGRHRYFRLASPEIAHAIEALLGAAVLVPGRQPGPTDPALRRARVCYDHLAGELAVTWLQAMREHGYFAGMNGMEPTASGADWCRQAGIDLDALRIGRRPLCKVCLDWSERRDHLAGSLGAAVLERLLDKGWVRRLPDSRALQVSLRGERWLTALR